MRHPGPLAPDHALAPEEWPNVLHRISEHHEPLRQVAADYGVSQETVRRLLSTSRKKKEYLSLLLPNDEV
jgi:hypothetical protein